MASAFAAQLQAIAANSSNELDLRARRYAHAQSLIFERDIAIKQEWDTIYQICLEGFQELCTLDGRLREFEQNLFSVHSKSQDRDQLNQAQNQELDTVLERCLSALSARLMIRPGVRAVEWLVRRFRIHVHNTNAMLCAFLPYHENPIFRNALSIIPIGNLVGDWKFLAPYRSTASNPPRHAVIYTATNNDGFFSRLNNFVLRSCQERWTFSGLMRFWSSIVVEALAARLDRAKSGRKEVERQRTEGELLKILPLVNEGLELKECPDMVLTCFAILILVCGTTSLDDKVTLSLMEIVSRTIASDEITSKPAIICLTSLCAQEAEIAAPKGVIMAFSRIGDLAGQLNQIKDQYQVKSLISALVRGSLAIVSKKNVSLIASFLQKLLGVGLDITSPAVTAEWLVLVAAKLQQFDRNDSLHTETRAALVKMLQNLKDRDEYTLAFSESLSLAANIDIDLEFILGSAVIPPQLPAPDTPDNMEVDKEESTDLEMRTILDALPSSTTQQSFLQTSSEALFNQVIVAFRACSHSSADIELFSGVPLWQSTDLTLLISFVLRIACGPYSSAERLSALRILENSLNDKHDFDTQFLLPYISCLLNDPAQSIRQRTSSVILAMEKCAPTSLVEGEEAERLGAGAFYDKEQQQTITTVSSNQLIKVIQQVYLPRLEECILDASQISRIMQNALNGNSNNTTVSTKVPTVDLKKSLRNGLFELLTSHAVSTPMLGVKVGIINLVDLVHKVGTQTKLKTLTPIVNKWLDFDIQTATRMAQDENLLLSHINTTFTCIFSSQDKDSVSRILTILTDDKIKLRTDFAGTLCARLKELWRETKLEVQVVAATQLFTLSFDPEVKLATEARDVLQTVTLATAVLHSLLEHSHSGLAQMQTEGPPKKRRRTSHGRDSILAESSTELNSVASRISFALELTENSKPERHPELLHDLFDILVVLRRLKDHNRTESPYLHNLCLSSILAIVEQAKSLRKPNIDLSGIRVELVTDTIRTSENITVQTSAIQLSAALASVVPDRMLHNIMPIFTFMGHSIFSKEDEHTVHVVNQAIDQIIPSLVITLKKQDPSSLIKSTASLLSSFTAAYDHIPHSRRLDFYQRLLNSLGPVDFAFALSSMLAVRKSKDSSTKSFACSLLANFTPVVQLVTYYKILELNNDILNGEFTHSEPLLGIGQSSTQHERTQAATLLYIASENLLRNKSLRSESRKLSQSNESETNNYKEQYSACLFRTLHTIRDRKQDGEMIIEVIQSCLLSLLDIPSLVDLFQILPVLLSDMESQNETDLKPQALHVLVTQIEKQRSKDKDTQSAAINFLKFLEESLQSVKNIAEQHVTISCIDKIAEVYGRKDIDAILSSASIVAGNSGIGSSDNSMQIISLLCLSSILDIAGEASIPIVPQAMPVAFSLLRNSLETDVKNIELHNAAYSFISAVLSQIPFMVSDQYLDQILELSATSASFDIDESAVESRNIALSLISRKLDLELLVSSLNKNWETLTDGNVNATLSLLDVLIESIENHSKSLVIKSADQVSALILRALDLRRMQSLRLENRHLSEAEIQQCETKINTLSIKFIYKLNDTIFRPIFETWIDWAVQGQDLAKSPESAKTYRQTSLFNFLAHFFETLKSIVTSYAGYIINPANTILQHMSELSRTKKPSLTGETLTLYKSLLSALTAAFTHDADSFFSAPSHFTSLAENLVAQLNLASSKSTRALIIDDASKVMPAIVALATATVDVPTLHHALNHHICQLRRHESSAVRLASIRTQLALTESEDVGEEWVNNVVGTGAEGGGGSGETMLYVNEMLEDDDEAVEAEVRRWVRMVRQQVGEDVFEM